ncbi:MAG: hypothetical protein EA412_01940 [Chitinophagaceae bacterium]|nr:MAG: hypothetical protein EA412_01940 [Chitinophagaceae bacterium]
MLRKYINILVISLLFSGVGFSQVKIGDNHTNVNPASIFEMESSNKGLLLPRMNTSQRDAIASPAEGLLIYNTENECVEVYNNIDWISLCSEASAGPGSGPDCSSTNIIIDGTVTHEVCIGDNNGSINLSVSGGASPYLYSWSGNAGNTQSISSLSPGTYTVTVTEDGGCAEFKTFVVNASQITVPDNPPAVSGNSAPSDNATGVVYSTSAVTSATDYNWTVPSGAVITGGQGSISITVDFTGTPAGNICVRAENVCGNSGYTCLSIVPPVSLGPCASSTDLVEVINSTTGRIWMDRNLGASRQAISVTDAQAYGCLFQWGRPDDGHAARNSSITSTQSSVPQPTHSDFIAMGTGSSDWLNPANDNLWQGLAGINNPCPAGFRLPTEAEAIAERNSWSEQTLTGAYNSNRKFTAAGFRFQTSGNLGQAGSQGFYWTSTVSGTQAVRLRIRGTANTADIDSDHRGRGKSVRCIKN